MEPGAEIIREGDEGRGLYVVLAGQLEVSARDPVSDRPVHLARLTTGEIFGEMSLIANQPTSATVRSLTRCTLLFLARVYVDRLSAAFPEVRAYFAEVAERRARDNNLTPGGRLARGADRARRQRHPAAVSARAPLWVASPGHGR